MKKIYTILALSTLLIFGACSSDDKNSESREIITETIPVETMNVEAETFQHFIEITGVLEPVQYAFISPEGSGQIKRILVSEGQTVSKGAILAELNTAVIEGQIQQVESQLELARITYEKQDELWNEKHVGSEIQYLQAKAQKESIENQLKALKSQKEMSIIKAPFSGIVDKINLKEGELASPGMRMIELVNLNKMKIKAEVSESLLPVIHKGDSVVITFPTYKGLEFKAPVFRTGNMINPANRTFTVELRVDNIDNKLKPYMVSTLKVNDYTLEKAITIPSIVIKKDFDREFVFISEKTDSNTVARKVYVETGRSYKNQSVVTKGLKVGDKVIVKGYNIVSAGASISSL
jgi:RND family efflux transporter MFP subunit